MPIMNRLLLISLPLSALFTTATVFAQDAPPGAVPVDTANPLGETNIFIIAAVVLAVAAIVVAVALRKRPEYLP